MIGLDVETTGLTPEDGRLRLVQVAGSRGTQVFDADEHTHEEVRSIFEWAQDRGVAAHNANFEELWAREYGVNLHLDDTLIMSRVLYGGTDGFRSRHHTLDDVARRELGVAVDKTEQTSDWSAELTASQLEYAKRDAEILRPLFASLLGSLKAEGLLKAYELENRVRPAVDAMERRGVAVHRDRLEALIAEYTARAVRLKAELSAEWGINPGSSKQLIEYFGLAGRRWPSTPGGAPKTNQDTMKRLIPEHPSVARWVEWKEAEKIRSTYGNSLLKRLTPEGRVHARFNAFGTATGRFSSSNPNLQNIPKHGERGKQMRGLFWSGSEGRVLIKADYASIELWLAAVLWDDAAMQSALREGVSMHVSTAAALFNCEPQDVSGEQKAAGKTVNFALLYGGSPKRLLEEFTKRGMPIDEQSAEELHAKFYATYKGFAKRKEIGRQVWNDWKYRDGDPPYSRTVIGRRRNFADWYGPLLNHEIQGTGADGIKFALARMHEDRGTFPDAYPVLTVHDEIVVEAPEYNADEIAAWVEHHMVCGMLDAIETEDVPSLPEVEIEIGREWS